MSGGALLGWLREAVKGGDRLEAFVCFGVGDAAKVGCGEMYVVC